MFDSSIPAPSIPGAVAQYLIECGIVLCCYLAWLLLIAWSASTWASSPRAGAIFGPEGLALAAGILIPALAALAASARGQREPGSIFAGGAGNFIWVLPALGVVAALMQLGFRQAWGLWFGGKDTEGLYLLLGVLPTFTAVAYSTARAVFRRALRARAARAAARISPSHRHGQDSDPI